MSKKISINIGRIIIGVPLKGAQPQRRSGAHEILQQILAGKFKDEDEDPKPNLSSIDDIKDALQGYIDAMETDITEIGQEEHPEKIRTDIDGFGEVDLVKAKELLSARVADLKPALDAINTAIANEEARQEAAKQASEKDSN